MKIVAASLLFALSLSMRPACATELWDSLPALEPVHHQGLYAGRRVCPMCAHGYDAGIMVFVPPSLSAGSAQALVRNLSPSALRISSGRFRIFILVTGEPAPTLLRSLRLEEPRWFVASLSGAALDKAEHDLGATVRQQTIGYVFAQRRLLHLLSSDDLVGANVLAPAKQSSYAMQFLGLTHPTPAVSSNPDAPKGALWFAPDRLRSTIELDAGAASVARTTCFTDAANTKLAEALVFVETDPSRAARAWMRSDAQGCIQVNGWRQDRGVVATLYTNLNPPLRAIVSDEQLRSTQNGAVTVAAKAIVEFKGGVTKRERVLGPCERCETVLEVPDTISSRARIVSVSEPGEPLHLQGRVLNREGMPVSGAIVFAYQTNNEGRYTLTAAKRIQLRGWARTDWYGRYEFDTIRPGGYPGRPDPAHIHMHVIEPGRCAYYISDVMFTDDPRLTDAHKQKESTRGGSGIVSPSKDRDGVWQAMRDITLGLNVPGYERCELP